MLKPTTATTRILRLVLITFAIAGLLPIPAAAQEWVQPERSQANLDALARVQVKTYKFEAAGNIEMQYGLYVPTKYDAARATPLVIALHGLGSDSSYMMEYNNLVELAERYGYIVATPMGYNPVAGTAPADRATNSTSGKPIRVRRTWAS